MIQYYHHASTCTTMIKIFFYTDVTFALSGALYGNNSIVTITDIGEEIHSALLCITTNINCCASINGRVGGWYLPNGTFIDGNGQNFYQNRGSSALRLFLRSGATSPNGVFHCQIPDASGALQRIYIGLFPTNAGEYLACSSRSSDFLNCPTIMNA